jgi:hypothetical protein
VTKPSRDVTPTTQHALVTVAIIALIAWRLYSRVRRSIGRQRLSAVRPWITLTVFPLLLLLLSFSLRAQPLTEMSLAAGLAAGIALGLLGLRLTRFEASARGLFYTPSAHLGIALSLLLVCRIAYRFMVNGLPGSAGGPPPATALTPLTLLILGTLAGYYCTYAIGLLRWSFRTRGAAAATQP